MFLQIEERLRVRMNFTRFQFSDGTSIPRLGSLVVTFPSSLYLNSCKFFFASKKEDDLAFAFAFGIQIPSPTPHLPNDFSCSLSISVLTISFFQSFPLSEQFIDGAK